MSSSLTISKWTPGETKFYKPDKGFGFVKLPERLPDAFLHVTILTASGYYGKLDKETRVEIRYVENIKGLCVVEIKPRGESTQQPRPQ